MHMIAHPHRPTPQVRATSPVGPLFGTASVLETHLGTFKTLRTFAISFCLILLHSILHLPIIPFTVERRRSLSPRARY